nr:TlpA disulfide reductase family protein [Mucilaginibacter sp. X5P1]
MNLRSIIIILLLALPGLPVMAQSSASQTYKIGDQIPDFEFRNLENAAGSTQNASHLYKDGLLIINFWATWCIPCIRELPYLDSIQAKNKQHMHVICVTDQSKDKLKGFLASNPGLSNLLFSSCDTTLKKFFPHSAIPHNVWIDKNGFVKAITGDDEITVTNIDKFLAGQTSLNQKRDLPFDFEKPLVVADSEFIYRSIFTKDKDEIGTGGVWLPDSMQQHTRFFGWNIPKTTIIWAAYMKSVFSTKDYKLIEFHAKDTSTYYVPSHINHAEWEDSVKMKKYKLWRKENLYCYEFSFRYRINCDSLYAVMVKEVNLFFNVSAKVENRKTNCWVITKIRSDESPAPSKDTTAIGLHLYQLSLIAQRQTWKQLAARLTDMYDQEPPFVDGTGTTFPVNINQRFTSLPNGFTIDVLRKYLNSIGLDIKLERVDYPHLVIYDHNN